MKKNKNIIQKEALNILKKNNYNGTVVLSTGTGKSKIAIDAIKEGNFKNILITSPRTNLKENWYNEIRKWFYKLPLNIVNKFTALNVKFTLENIQTCYKWDYEQFNQFDLIIADEIHTLVTEKYGELIYEARNAGIPVIGLTATPDNDKEDKAEFYAINCPILYEYYDSADDGLINKRRHLVYQYELSNDHIVQGGTKKKPFDIGELDQYTYLSEQIRKGQRLMAGQLSLDFWNDAVNWFYKGQGNFEQKTAGRIYLNGIKYRKEFLWNLTSSAEIALQIKNNILNKVVTEKLYFRDELVMENPILPFKRTNKVLIFSENIKQAEKLSKYSIHSKQDIELNKKLLKDFDGGIIKELSSVRSLTLGLNITGANYVIRESYNGSNVNSTQINGRSDRLDVNDVATVIWIVPTNTQSEQWFTKATKTENKENITYYTDITKLTTKL